MQTLAEIPCEGAITIGPDETVDCALGLLLESATTELYVIDAEQRLLGVVPDYELLKARLNGSWQELTVRQVMSHHVLCYTVDSTVAEALKSFREGRHSRAAVLENGRVIGQITRRTLLKSLWLSADSPTPKSCSVAAPKFLQAGRALAELVN